MHGPPHDDDPGKPRGAAHGQIPAHEQHALPDVGRPPIEVRDAINAKDSEKSQSEFRLFVKKADQAAAHRVAEPAASAQDAAPLVDPGGSAENADVWTQPRRTEFRAAIRPAGSLLRILAERTAR